MSDPKNPVYRVLSSEDLENIDREIARLAAIGDKSADSFRRAKAAAIQDAILESLKKSFPNVLAGRLPGP